jgi:hypothetical protein
MRAQVVRSGRIWIVSAVLAGLMYSVLALVIATPASRSPLVGRIIA